MDSMTVAQLEQQLVDKLSGDKLKMIVIRGKGNKAAAIEFYKARL